MPRTKTDVNKSELVREIFASNPKASVKEVQAKLLQSKNVKVQPSLVYFIRAKMKKANRKAIREKAAQVTGGSNGNTLEIIRKVKGLAADVGGLGRLKQLVDMLAE